MSKEKQYKEALEYIAGLMKNKPFCYDWPDEDIDWFPAATGNYDDTFDLGRDCGVYEVVSIAKEKLLEIENQTEQK